MVVSERAERRNSNLSDLFDLHRPESGHGLARRRTRIPVSLLTTVFLVALGLFQSSPASGAELCGERVQVTQGSLKKPIWTIAEGPEFPSGAAPDTVGVYGNEAREIYLDPSDSYTIYTADWDTVLRSKDGGCTWTPVFSIETGSPEAPPTIRCDVSEVYSIYGPGCAKIASIDVAPPIGDDPPRVYVQVMTYWAANPVYVTIPTAFTTTVFVSEDGGSSFRSIHDPSADGLASQVGFGDLVVAPSDPRTIYVTRADWGRSDVFVSKDAGHTWARQGSLGGVLNPDGLSVDPKDPNKLWDVAASRISTSGLRTALVHSEDGGATWSEKTGPFTSPVATGVGLAGGEPVTIVTEENRIWVSRDGGNQWSDMPPGCKMTGSYGLTFGGEFKTAFILCTTDGLLRLNIDRGLITKLTTGGITTGIGVDQEKIVSSPAGAIGFFAGCAPGGQHDCRIAIYRGTGT